MEGLDDEVTHVLGRVDEQVLEELGAQNQVVWVALVKFIKKNGVGRNDFVDAAEKVVLAQHNFDVSLVVVGENLVDRDEQPELKFARFRMVQQRIDEAGEEMADGGDHLLLIRLQIEALEALDEQLMFLLEMV